MIYKLNDLFGRITEKSQDASWTLFRVLVSAMYITHGYGKLFGENPQPFMGGGITTVNIGDVISLPMPFEVNALFLAGSIELFGGLLILVGLWTHLIAFVAMLNMLMAYLIAHIAWFPTLNNGELAAMYFLTYLILFTFGPGPVSADYWLAERRREKLKEKMKQNS